MMDAFNEPGITTVVIMSSAQIGKTTLLRALIGYHIDQDPAPILCLNPTLEMSETFSKDRLAPMIRDTPCLSGKVADPRARDSGNTLLHKTFPGGHLTMAGANSPASLASRPIRVLLCDEIDRYPPSAGAEGDPVNLALKRTATFYNRRVLLTSTPTIKGVSRIERAFLDSDQRFYLVPCPHCGHEHRLEWANVRWDEGDPETAYMVCPECGAAIHEGHKARMLARGRWQATQPTRACAGFHLNELYSPWRRWADVVIDFLHAKRSAESLKAWVNTSLGETWEEQAEKSDPQALLSRRESYTPDSLPPDVLYLTAGVDVQDDRIEVEIVGWRQDGRDAPPESWGVEYRILHGNPSMKSVWSDLDALLLGEYQTQDRRRLRISAVCIDSGGHHTAAVYAFCEARRGRHVYAVKGLSGARPIWKAQAGRSRKYQAAVWHVGVDTAKDAWYSRLRITEPGPGYCHFSTSYTEAYFEGLTAEQVRTRYHKGHPVREWYLPSGRRNEPLDIRVYALAALLARPVAWAQLADQAGSPLEHTPAPKAIKRRVSSWW